MADDEGHHCIDYDFNPEYSGKGYAAEAGRKQIRERKIDDTVKKIECGQLAGGCQPVSFVKAKRNISHT